jgi:hypothetical protein
MTMAAVNGEILVSTQSMDLCENMLELAASGSYSFLELKLSGGDGLLPNSCLDSNGLFHQR